jgi:two-component system, OmpR family, phosphate regulon response regulator PhoB
VAAQVLIVEDDPDIVTAIQVNLELAGYGVHVAHDGSQAVGIARQVRPDVVLLDVVLPGVDGYEVLHALRGDPLTRECKVIFLSAKSSPSMEVRKGFEGVVDYIVKPFAPADLLARMRAAFDEGSSK